MIKVFLKRVFVFAIILITAISAVPIQISSDKYQNNEVVDFHNITVKEILHLNSKQIESISGENLNFKSKLVLRLLKKNIRADVKSGKLQLDTKVDFNNLFAEEIYEFNVGGFLLGFFLGLIGVGLAHIFSDDYSFRKSSWKGWGVSVIILLLIFLL